MESKSKVNVYDDHLLTPQNSALLIIDYQPIQVASIASMDKRLLVSNVVSVARGAKLFGLPTVISTVNVKNGKNKPTIHQLQEIFAGVDVIDRTTLNAWEDDNFIRAVKETDRKKLIMVGLWTEVCLAFPALSAIKDGYEVYPIVDAVGSTSIEAHRAGLKRIYQAGAKPSSWTQLLCELQRDWSREETAGRFAELLFKVEVM